MFNNHYIIIVQKTACGAPKSLDNSTLVENDSKTVTKVIKHYRIIQALPKLEKIYLEI